MSAITSDRNNQWEDRKRVVAQRSRCERACKRTGEASVVFCGEEERYEVRDDESLGFLLQKMRLRLALRAAPPRLLTKAGLAPSGAPTGRTAQGFESLHQLKDNAHRGGWALSLAESLGFEPRVPCGNTAFRVMFAKKPLAVFDGRRKHIAVDKILDFIRKIRVQKR